MHRIDTSTASANENGTGKAGFVAANQSASPPVAATHFDPDWCNAVQEEPANVIEAVGLTLTKGTNTQLLDAIKIMLWSAILGAWQELNGTAFASTPSAAAIQSTGEIFVVGASGMIRGSTDGGASWSTYAAPGAFGGQYNAAAAGGTSVYAVGDDELHRRTGAGVWSAVYSVGGSEVLSGVAANDTTHYTCGHDGGGSGAIYDDVGGAETIGAGVTSTNFVDIATDGTDWVCIGDAGSNYEILKLISGTWEQQADAAGNLSSVHYCATLGLWVAVGDVILVSPDGETWTSGTSSFSSPSGGVVTSTSSLLVHAQPDGKVEGSHDGISWQRIGDVGASIADLTIGDRAFAPSTAGDALATGYAPF